MTDPHPTLILPSIVPDTNPSIPLGSPMGQYANLGQGIRAKDQGPMNDPQPTLILPSNPRLQRARDRIRDRSSRVESNPVGMNPTQLATLVTLYSCLHPTPEIAEAESKALDNESVLDSGSSVHTKGNNLTTGECDVVHLNAPYTLGTAGDTDMEVHTLGTYTHTYSLLIP